MPKKNPSAPRLLAGWLASSRCARQPSRLAGGQPARPSAQPQRNGNPKHVKKKQHQFDFRTP